MNYVVSVGDESFNIQVPKPEEIVVNEECHVASIESAGGPSLYSLIVDNSSYELFVEEKDECYRVLLLGQLYNVQVEDEASRLAAKARPGRTFLEEEDTVIRSPIPGLVFDVPVTEGQEVEVGDILVIVEAMKMENELRALRPGTVQATHVGPGDRVAKGQVLVTIA